MSDFENAKCPKCSGVDVDPQTGYSVDESGETDSIDYDPVCVKCRYPLGDDWYSEELKEVEHK